MIGTSHRRRGVEKSRFVDVSMTRSKMPAFQWNMEHVTSEYVCKSDLRTVFELPESGDQRYIDTKRGHIRPLKY
jgi:hypothetical protein